MQAKSLFLFLTAALSLPTGDKAESSVAVLDNEAKAPGIDLKAKTRRETEAFLGRPRAGDRTCTGDEPWPCNSWRGRYGYGI